MRLGEGGGRFIVFHDLHIHLIFFLYFVKKQFVILYTSSKVSETAAKFVEQKYVLVAYSPFKILAYSIRP